MSTKKLLIILILCAFILTFLVLRWGRNDDNWELPQGDCQNTAALACTSEVVFAIENITLGPNAQIRILNNDKQNLSAFSWRITDKYGAEKGTGTINQGLSAYDMQTFPTNVTSAIGDTFTVKASINVSDVVGSICTFTCERGVSYTLI